METQFLTGLGYTLRVEEAEFVAWSKFLDGFMLSHQRQYQRSLAMASQEQALSNSVTFPPCATFRDAPRARSHSPRDSSTGVMSAISFSPTQGQKRSAGDAFQIDDAANSEQVAKSMRIPQRRGYVHLPGAAQQQRASGSQLNRAISLTRSERPATQGDRRGSTPAFTHVYNQNQVPEPSASLYQASQARPITSGSSGTPLGELPLNTIIYREEGIPGPEVCFKVSRPDVRLTLYSNSFSTLSLPKLTRDKMDLDARGPCTTRSRRISTTNTATPCPDNNSTPSCSTTHVSSSNMMDHITRANHSCQATSPTRLVSLHSCMLQLLRLLPAMVKITCRLQIHTAIRNINTLSVSQLSRPQRNSPTPDLPPTSTSPTDTTLTNGHTFLNITNSPLRTHKHHTMVRPFRPATLANSLISMPLIPRTIPNTLEGSCSRDPNGRRPCPTMASSKLPSRVIRL